MFMNCRKATILCQGIYLIFWKRLLIKWIYDINVPVRYRQHKPHHTSYYLSKTHFKSQFQLLNQRHIPHLTSGYLSLKHLASHFRFLIKDISHHNSDYLSKTSHLRLRFKDTSHISNPVTYRRHLTYHFRLLIKDTS